MAFRRVLHAIYKKGKGLSSLTAELRRQQWLPPRSIREMQEQRLTHLLAYAADYCPYYQDIFAQVGLVRNGMVCLERFSDLPLLDKPLIRDQFDRLKSTDLANRRWFYKTTGGSTGQPLKVIHDAERTRWIEAVRDIHNDWCSIAFGESKLRLWGSERDLFFGREPTLVRLNRYLANTTWLNAFRMTPERMREYVDIINRVRPRHIKGYAHCLFEFCRYVRDAGLEVHSPRSIISAAGTLTPLMRQEIETVFRTKVFDSYGSREIQAMAFECEAHKGLHVSAPLVFCEILRADGTAAQPGELGEIVLTPFFNYAMPLIRYRIGDMGVWAEESCSCGRSWPLLAEVSGRVTECFYRKDGGVVPPEYFIHLVGVVLNDGWIDKFQVIQNSHDMITVKLVCDATLADPAGEFANRLTELRDKIKLVMGSRCSVEFAFVKEIPESASGKYFYTQSLLTKPSA